jgi:tripartite-type tricarboxylate transporter receptor subunit TctC
MKTVSTMWHTSKYFYLVVSLSMVPAFAANAQVAPEFFRGKTIMMYIGTGESAGAVGAYPRAISQVIRKYIPGNPNVVVSNMPGAGGIKLANFIQSQSLQDGLQWAFITRGFMLAPLLKVPGAQFEPTKFNWIGSPARTVSVGAVWTANTKIRTIEEAMKEEVVLGATAPNQDTAIFPNALNRLTGTKFRIVTGYSSVGQVDIAMQRGEIDGKVGFTWGSLMSGSSANWVRDGKVKVLVQLGMSKSRDIPTDVPLALDLAKTPEDRQVLEILCGPSATGYPSFMGPNVPKDRVAIIRAAYEATMKDPEFIDILQKQQLELDPIDGVELEAIVRDLYAKPASAVERTKAIVPQG